MEKVIIARSIPEGGYHFGIGADRQVIFIPQKLVETNRWLQPGDVVLCDVVPNPKKPGWLVGTNVRYVGPAQLTQGETSEGGQP